MNTIIQEPETKISPFKIRDGQAKDEGAYLWNGHIFANHEEARKALLSYHIIDAGDSKFALRRMTLEELLEYGGWEVEEVDNVNELRLQYLRTQIRSESISYAELAELRTLIQYIPLDDVELLEPAGVKEQHLRVVEGIMPTLHERLMLVQDNEPLDGDDTETIATLIQGELNRLNGNE